MSRFKKFTESSNPIMKEEVYRKVSDQTLDGEFMGEEAIAGQKRMTVSGAINKTFILFGLMMITTVISYMMPSMIFLLGGAIGGLIVVFITAAKPSRSTTWAPVYAILEGLFVGSVTAMYASFMSGIIFQAVSLTFAVLFMMLFIYKSGIIKVTNKFRTGVMMATGAVLLVYVVNIVLSFFGMNIPYLHEGGMIGIGISLVIIGIAALNLLLDFDNFEKGEKYGAPIYMEWFSAMGLLITLVWLYIEILRLLAILNSSD
jgi:uncharacterized YccA/Bax inhibitor family protein